MSFVEPVIVAEPLAQPRHRRPDLPLFRCQRKSPSHPPINRRSGPATEHRCDIDYDSAILIFNEKHGGARSCLSTSCPASARTIARAPARSRSSASSPGSRRIRIGRIRGASSRRPTRAASSAPRSRAMPSASITPTACRSRCAGSARRASGRAAFAPISWDDALDEVAERLTRAAQRHGVAGGVALLLRRHDGDGAARRHQPAAPRDALFARGSDDLQRAGRHRLARRGRRQARRRRARDRQIRPDRRLGRQPGFDPGQRDDPHHAGAAGTRRQARRRRPLPHRQRRGRRPASGPAARHRRRARLRGHARAVQRGLCRPRLHGAP